MTRVRRASRRIFLKDLGRGAVALAVVSLGAACSDDDDGNDDAGAGAAGTPTATASRATSTPTQAESTPAPSATPAASDGGSGVAAVEWQQVSLGFVSAYVLARGGEAAIVDTGTGGSEGAIADALGVAGLGWDDVGHVILTHLHGDHIGSLPAVLEQAADGTGYAGAGDIPAISSPRPLLAVGDGDRVFDLEIIETPGHTPGHISVLDPVGGLLVAGDALNGEAGGVVGPNERFSSDLSLANASVVKLAGLEFETVVFGHGDPVVSGASVQVAALAAEL